MRLRKIAASIALSAGLAGGGLAVAALSPIQGVQATPGSAGAAPTTQPPAGTSGSASDPANTAGADRQGPLEQALAGLVKDGTLTQDQADSVQSAFRQERQQGRGRRFLRRHGKQVVDVAATAIGVAPADLKAALKAGKSIADVASAKGVDPQKAVDALSAAGKAKVEEAVTAGKLTRDRAARIEQRLPDLARRLVEARRKS
ncbi:MAG: hypothetical protein HYX34_15420 [Actinobacteria bacterium]|nr:hypothetical protein [Actinomycetota bacterium]